MNRFTKKRAPASPDTIRQLKAWVQEILSLSADTPVSISQLQCHEPGCSPVETVIAIMLQPVQTFKIHGSIEEVTQANLLRLLRPKQPQLQDSETKHSGSEDSLDVVRSQ